MKSRDTTVLYLYFVHASHDATKRGKKHHPTRSLPSQVWLDNSVFCIKTPLGRLEWSRSPKHLLKARRIGK